MSAPVDFILHLADNALVLGQRNAEWCGHGPVLEEDLAMANISLDLIGQARLLYQHAAAQIGGDATEDSLAYFRDEPQFRNYLMLELPHRTAFVPGTGSDRDYAVTIARNFLYSTFALLFWEALKASSDAQLSAIADKSLKETRYHVRHSTDWLIRFGDGTEQSHARARAALDFLMPYTQEFWTVAGFESAAHAMGAAVPAASLREAWDRSVDTVLAQATLRRPSDKGFAPRGKEGLHSEHMGYLLGEMQSLARAHPGAQW